jgi:hypothetical protein
MMKIKTLLALALAALFPILGLHSTASAEWAGGSTTQPGPVEVAYIQIEPGGIYIAFKTAPFASTTCTAGGGTNYWKLGGTADIAKLLSTFTAAKLSGIKVNVLRPDSPSAACSGGSTGYPLLTGVTLG